MKSSHLWLLTLALAFLCAASAAQQPTTMSAGSSGGITTISVRVTYQQNHRPASGMRVELIASLGGMASMRTTDGNGGATFDGVGTGRFEVRLTEKADANAPGPALAPIIPEAARQEFNLGSKEMDKKHWEEAKVHFQKAITAFPKYAEAFNNLGQVEIQLKDGKNAVEAFRSATQIDPTVQQANLYLGQFYYENTQYKVAEPYLLHAAADQPKSAKLLTALASTEMQNGESDLAIANAR